MMSDQSALKDQVLFQPRHAGEGVWKIWDASRNTDHPEYRIEFPYLIRFKDHWYCTFREGVIHDAHPSGRCRIIRSSDGKSWDTVALFTWDGGDVREVKLSITAEGWLMANTGITFVSREPRDDGSYRFAEHGTLMSYRPDDEPGIIMQSVTWMSRDGEHWSSAYACPSGANTWRWDTVWHMGMGYSVGQCGKDAAGTLYRTRDGKSWRTLLHPFFPPHGGNEGSLAFAPDGRACCLLRDACPRPPHTLAAQQHLRRSDGHHISASHAGMFHGSHVPMIGIGAPPTYQQWQWRELCVDYGPEHGGERPAHEVFHAPLGGPKLMYLRDGRLLAAARMLGPGRDDGRITLFRVDPDKALLTWLTEFDGTTYGGLVEHDGMLWATYVGSACHRDQWEVYLAKVNFNERMKV